MKSLLLKKFGNGSLKLPVFTVILFIMVFAFIDLHAQVSINTDGADPDGSAMLDIQSTTKGMLVPRMSDVERDAIANPATGLMVFVNTDSSFYYFDGTAWQGVSPAPDSEELADQAGFPNSVLHTAALQTPGESFQIIVEDNYAYVNRINGLNDAFLDVYNVGDPANISHTATYDPVNFSIIGGLDVISSKAVLSEGASREIEIVDISNPANPSFQSWKNDGIDSKFFTKFYSDNILFSHSIFFGGELEIREFSTNTIKLLTLGAEPVDMAFSGTYAFVTNRGNDLLQIVDFSDIPNASVVHTVALGSDPGSISISGNYAYVANNGTDMLEVIDISNPLTASVVHTVNLGSDPRQVHTNDYYAFVLDESNALFQIIDIANPASASLLESLNIGGSPKYFDIEGGYAFVVNNNGGTNEMQVLTIPTANSFLPLYGMDGNISGYTAPSTVNHKIDQFDLFANTLQLSIAGDGEAPKTVDLSGYLDNTDAQSISLNSNTLSLTNGGSVDLSGYLDADNLGNHTATQNIQLGSNWLSGDGGNEGLKVSNDGYISVGNIAVGAESTGQGTSTQSGNGFLTTPWIYTNAIEAQGQRGSQSTLITVGNDGTYGVDNEIHLVTKGNSGFMMDADGKVGIGTGSPAEKLHVEGSIRMVDGNQQAGYIATSDANGTMIWSNPEGLIETVTLVTLDTLLGSAPTNGTPLQDASQESGPSGFTFLVGESTWQSFTAERSGNLVQVDLNHYTNGLDNGTLRIYEGEGTQGALLHEQSISGTTDWSSYPLTTGVPITTGAQYSIWVTATDNFIVLFNGYNPYSGGRMQDGVNYDARFRTYVIPPTEVFALDPTTGSISFGNGSMVVEANGDVTFNGQVSMQHNIAWGETTATQYKQDETVGATYQNITTTSSLDVRTGDILKIEGWVSMKMNEGSGTDLFNIRVSASGCSNFTTNLLDNIGPPRDSGDRQDYRQYSYGDVHVATCDGSYTFTLQINNTGDDDWTVKDALLIVTKY
jgi:hypothetical protein